MFLAGVSRFASRSAFIGALVHFRTLWLFESLYISLDRLFDAPLYMGLAMKKGDHNCVGVFFGIAQIFTQCTSQHGALDGTVHKLVQMVK